MDQSTHDRPTALRCVWNPDLASFGMVPLREHITVLCEMIFEHGYQEGHKDWWGVTESLRLAGSLENVFAGTPGVRRPGSCGNIEELDEAYNDMARMHLACVIVFSLVWTAYEGAVTIVDVPRKKRAAGEHGRDLLERELLTAAPAGVREVLEEARKLMPAPEPGKEERLSGLLDRGLVAAAAAEYLRQFRNGTIHGSISRPLSGLGDGCDDPIEDDPQIVVFHWAIRLTTLAIQMIFMQGFEHDAEIDYSGDVVLARELFAVLHLPQAP